MYDNGIGVSCGSVVAVVVAVAVVAAVDVATVSCVVVPVPRPASGPGARSAVVHGCWPSVRPVLGATGLTGLAGVTGVTDITGVGATGAAGVTGTAGALCSSAAFLAVSASSAASSSSRMLGGASSTERSSPNIDVRRSRLSLLCRALSRAISASSSSSGVAGASCAASCASCASCAGRSSSEWAGASSATAPEAMRATQQTVSSTATGLAPWRRSSGWKSASSGRPMRRQPSRKCAMFAGAPVAALSGSGTKPGESAFSALCVQCRQVSHAGASVESGENGVGGGKLAENHARAEIVHDVRRVHARGDRRQTPPEKVQSLFGTRLVRECGKVHRSFTPPRSRSRPFSFFCSLFFLEVQQLSSVFSPSFLFPFFVSSFLFFPFLLSFKVLPEYLNTSTCTQQ